MNLIDSLKEFLSGFAARLTPGVDDFPLSFTLLSQHGEGSLLLDQEDQAGLRRQIALLHRHYGKDKTLSRRAVERALHNALFIVADPRSTRSGTPFDRISSAVVEIRSALSAPPIRFDWWIPVRGFDHSDLPTQFAGHGLMVMADVAEEVRVLRRQRRSTPESNPDALEHILTNASQAPGVDLDAIRVQVEARDSDAAEELARQKATQIVDVLNFFGPLVPFHFGQVSMPTWGTSAQTISFAVGFDGRVSAPRKHEGPHGGYSMARLREAEALARPLAAAERLLEHSNPKRSFAGVMLSAVSWAGRAAVARSREEAFLLLAIASESLLLPDGDPRELSYRLAFRTSSFLSDIPETKQRMFKDVKRLYDIRSAIVHSGSYEVSDQDLAEIHGLSRAVILRALVDPELGRMQNKEAGAWFDQKTLGYLAT